MLETFTADRLATAGPHAIGDAHKASERIDAGAYGATNGDRILRFLVDANPARDRVWASKGDFGAVFRRHAQRAGFTGPGGHVGRLDKNALDHLRTALLKGLSALAPINVLRAAA
jgi:hypothetical protein